MALVLRDRVKETTTSTGTGTITLAGAASGFQSFSVIGNANVTYYAIVGQSPSTEWEIGIGTYTASGTTLSRDTVLESSNANALVTFSAGIKDVFVTYPADYAVVSSNNFGTSGQVLTSTGPNTAATWQTVGAQRVVVITNATSITVNADTTDIATQTNTQAAGTLTINAPTGTPVNGQKFILRLQATNTQTFSFNAIFAGSTDLALPTTSSSGGKYDYLGFVYNSTATKWQLLAKVFGF